MQQIVFASSNLGKITEVNELFAGTGFEIISQEKFNVGVVEETGISFVENALIKARHAACKVDCPVIADDSGLIVNLLGGAPGVISARYAGEGSSDHDNRQKLISELKNKKLLKAEAHLYSVMVSIKNFNDAAPIICYGIWHGEVICECKGNNDFGYGPMFYVPELGCTISQMDRATKNAHSHRAQAVTKLKKKLIELYK